MSMVAQSKSSCQREVACSSKGRQHAHGSQGILQDPLLQVLIESGRVSRPGYQPWSGIEWDGDGTVARPTRLGGVISETLDELHQERIQPEDVPGARILSMKKEELDLTAMNLNVLQAHVTARQQQLRFEKRLTGNVTAAIGEIRPGTIFKAYHVSPYHYGSPESDIPVDDPNRVHSQYGPKVAKDRHWVALGRRGKFASSGHVTSFNSGNGGRGRPPADEIFDYALIAKRGAAVPPDIL